MGNMGSMYAGTWAACTLASRRQLALAPTRTSPSKPSPGNPSPTSDSRWRRGWGITSSFMPPRTLCRTRHSTAVPDLPVLDELDTEPTEEHLGKAMDCLSTGKAPDEDVIPPEIMKSGKDALLQDLHELLCLCWREGAVPKDMRNTKIVILYKNKGDRSDCNNYRGISLLSIVGKVFTRVLLAHLQVLAARFYPESRGAESSLPVAHPGYQVLSDILFRLGLIANALTQCSA